MTKQVKASEFQENCLALVDEVASTGQTVIVTKDGKPVAELVPHRAVEPAAEKSPFGIWKGELEILGNIVSPTADRHILDWPHALSRQDAAY